MLLILFIIVIFILQNKIHLKQKKNYIFAYGSLTNYYIQKILLKNSILYPKAILKKNFGYKRYWLESKVNGVTLGIMPSKTPKDINGILINISDDELKKFDKYEIEESNHTKLKIDWKFIDCEKKYKNSNLYVYVIINPPKKVDIVKKIPNLYAQTVMQGFLQYGEDYLNLFLKTTK